MKKFKIVALFLLIIFSLVSCKTYTIHDGLDNINIAEEIGVQETRYNEIVRIKAEEEAERARVEAEAKAERERIEAERAKAEADKKAEMERIEAEKKAEEIRKYEEEQALKKSLANLNAALDKQAAINPYPQNLAELKLPHIYRPVNTKAVLNDKFTKFEVLFLPLGQDERSDENLALISQNISTIPLEFIFVTGSEQNQVNFAKALDKDAVTLSGGTIIFTVQVDRANENNVTFKVSENKTLDATVIDVTNEGYKETLAMIDSEYAEAKTKDSKSFNLGLFTKLSKDNVDNNEREIDTALANTGETTLFAISQSEPAVVDWDIFTPYSYRTEFDWPLSTYILEQGYRDTFEETRYSVEESAGITKEIGKYVKERFDFLYSKGLMEVTSSTLAISGLSDTENPTFALIATYIMP